MRNVHSLADLWLHNNNSPKTSDSSANSSNNSEDNIQGVADAWLYVPGSFMPIVDADAGSSTRVATTSNAIGNTAALVLASTGNTPNAITGSSNQDIQADTSLWLQDMSNPKGAGTSPDNKNFPNTDTDLWLQDMTDNSNNADAGSGSQDPLHKNTDLWLEDMIDGGLKTVTPSCFTLLQDFVFDWDFASLPDNWFHGDNDLDELMEEN
ncbi:hypothetical protein B0H34DRAFT_674424 [Crassisporium funariophilum]|nr:hypothetical protein B0H34DRAFT_674424 [Crassisporium funariophilum]